MEETRNCHEYCRYGRICHFRDGKVGQDPEECVFYYKIEDLLLEAMEERDDNPDYEPEFEGEGENI